MISSLRIKSILLIEKLNKNVDLKKRLKIKIKPIKKAKEK